MATVTIVDNKNNSINLPVSDKAHAIREVSRKLINHLPRKTLEAKLNGWLSSSMKETLYINFGDEYMLIAYRD